MITSVLLKLNHIFHEFLVYVTNTYEIGRVLRNSSASDSRKTSER